jgi:lipoprotein-anchoring transpeptidase ErfK/SrfK
MRIQIDLGRQEMALKNQDGSTLKTYAVSTSRYGAGERNGSFCTPRGRHVIRARIGASQPENTVFVRRRPTGELWTPDLYARFPGRDWILTRILWLSGREPGRNRWGDVDTMRRYIYIHGTHEYAELGKPGSIGCVRMGNRDMIELFDLVTAGTAVDIRE